MSSKKNKYILLINIFYCYCFKSLWKRFESVGDLHDDAERVCLVARVLDFTAHTYFGFSNGIVRPFPCTKDVLAHVLFQNVENTFTEVLGCGETKHIFLGIASLPPSRGYSR